jgi:hypothetical protein
VDGIQVSVHSCIKTSLPTGGFFYFQQMQTCFFCGAPQLLVHVHGHYQCATCGTNAMPCCDGDNCHTSLITDPLIRRSDSEETHKKQEFPKLPE